MALLTFYCIFIYSYRFAYNFVVEINSWYVIFAGALVCLFIALLLQYKPGSLIELHFADLIFLILLVAGLLFMIAGFRSLSIHNEFFINCLTFICLYFIFRVSPSFILKEFIPLVIGVLFLYELFNGGTQLIVALKSNISPGSYVIGDLENSGVYSFFLVINLPIVFYCFNNPKLPAPLKKILFVALASTVCLLIVFVQARTAIMAMLVFIMLALLAFKPVNLSLKSAYKKNIFLVIVLVVFSIVIFYLTGIKAGSMNGRLLILKVCLQNFKQFFIAGIGAGRFSYYYPLWQIDYFSTNENVAADYFINADESHVAFNEPLEIFTETGIIGITIAGLLVIHLLKVKANYQLLFVLKATIVLITVCSVTSYPLHCNAVLFILAYCMAFLIRIEERKSFISVRNKKATFIVLLLLNSACAFYSFRSAYYISQWNTIRNDVFKDSSQIIKAYDNITPKLQGNGKFLLEMGEQYADIGNTSKAISILEESKQTYISYRTFNSTAIAYYQASNYAKAIENLEMASNLIPSRFTTKLELLNIYLLHTDTIKAVQMAKIILAMPVKKSSLQVDEIKRQASEILSNLHR